MENANSDAARYHRGAVALHWLMAVLIILNVIGAFVSEDLPKPDRALIMGLHKSTGFVLLLLALARLGWRIKHRPPPMVASLKGWEVALSKVAHFGFYVLMIGLPLSGWALVSAFGKGEGISVFGLFGMPELPVGTDRPSRGLFHEMHEIMGFSMIGLFVLHVVGAIKHQFLDRDGTLRRMMPWMS